MARFFVNYRREDAGAEAARIRDRLVTVFGPDNVFMDVDDLRPGQRFDQELAKALDRCNVFLAVIGPRWYDLLYERAQTGGRDYVREEIGTALARGITVVPILIDAAALPRAEALPDDLHLLVVHHAYQIRHEHFGRDVDALVAALGKPHRNRSVRGTRVGWRRIGVVASVVWVFVGFFFGSQLADQWEMDAQNRSYRIVLTCQDQAKAEWSMKNPGATIDENKSIYPSEVVNLRNKCYDQERPRVGHLEWWLLGRMTPFALIPFAWVLAWVVLRLGRWIHRGFN